MTWIVGKIFLSGYIAILSDVQVTWGKGNHRKDCLKKVYPVANNIVAGFSGSVDTGFLLLHDLEKYIKTKTETGEAVIPRIIAHSWYRRARKIHSDLPKSSRKLGCSIIMAGVSPLENRGDMNLPHSDIIVFREKKGFEPQYHKGFKSISIGSGNSVKAYKDFLDGSDDLTNIGGLSNADGHPSGGGRTLALLISIVLQDNVHPGVSSNVHCTLVNRFGVEQFPVNYSVSNDEGDVARHTMPKVAETYSEFKEFEKNNIKGIGVAIA